MTLFEMFADPVLGPAIGAFQRAGWAAAVNPDGHAILTHGPAAMALLNLNSLDLYPFGLGENRPCVIWSLDEADDMPLIEIADTAIAVSGYATNLRGAAATLRAGAALSVIEASYEACLTTTDMVVKWRVSTGENTLAEGFVAFPDDFARGRAALECATALRAAVVQAPCPWAFHCLLQEALDVNHMYATGGSLHDLAACVAGTDHNGPSVYVRLLPSPQPSLASITVAGITGPWRPILGRQDAMALIGRLRYLARSSFACGPRPMDVDSGDVLE